MRPEEDTWCNKWGQEDEEVKGKWSIKENFIRQISEKEAVEEGPLSSSEDPQKSEEEALRQEEECSKSGQREP